MIRQSACARQIVERREQQPLREVASDAEYGEHARINLVCIHCLTISRNPTHWPRFVRNRYPSVHRPLCTKKGPGGHSSWSTEVNAYRLGDDKPVVRPLGTEDGDHKVQYRKPTPVDTSPLSVDAHMRIRTSRSLVDDARLRPRRAALSETEKVSSVFRGIGARDANLATKYINPKNYVEHNPLAADGIDGVKEYIGQLPHLSG
jgi:hypothetical protein